MDTLWLDYNLTDAHRHAELFEETLSRDPGKDYITLGPHYEKIRRHLAILVKSIEWAGDHTHVFERLWTVNAIVKFSKLEDL